MKSMPHSLVRDASVIALSIICAVLLAKTGVLVSILTSTQEMEIISSFISGLFFVSVFTAAPAGVVLYEIAAVNSIWLVAFFGALGGLCGDLLIFHFIKDSLATDIRWIIKQLGFRRLLSFFRKKLLLWLMPIVGAVIVASPFPDEIGLAMMGLSKMKLKHFIPLSFTLNFLGILTIGYIARS